MLISSYYCKSHADKFCTMLFHMMPHYCLIVHSVCLYLYNIDIWHQLVFVYGLSLSSFFFLTHSYFFYSVLLPSNSLSVVYTEFFTQFYPKGALKFFSDREQGVQVSKMTRQKNENYHCSHHRLIVSKTKSNMKSRIYTWIIIIIFLL